METLRTKLAWAIFYPFALLTGWWAITGPSNIVWGKRFVGSIAGVTAGDHVQMSYYLWLWWHAIATRSHLPWTDPFQFAATGHVTHQPFGWPLVLVSLPVQAIWGPIAAFNAVLYASIVAAGGATFLWARALKLPRHAAAVAGFAFAFAPFRLAQALHINSYVGFLLPLTLFFAERALRGDAKRSRLAGWGCAASFVSLTASGEMHVVVYFAPLFAAYVAVRAWGVGWDRIRPLLLPAAALGIGAMAFIGITYKIVFIPSVRAGANTSNTPKGYAPHFSDIVARSHASEHTAYPGALVFVLAILGTLAWLRRPARQLVAGLFVLIIVGCYFLALLPGWGVLGLRLYNDIWVLHRIIVPGRIIVVAALVFAVLAAAGVASVRTRTPLARGAIATIAIGVILLDASGFTRHFNASAAEPNLTPAIPQGASVLDLPPFPAGHFFASRYSYEILEDPGPHVGGYSIFITPAADQEKNSANVLARFPPDPCAWRDVSKQLHFRYVTVHQALFGTDHPNKWHATDGKKLAAALEVMPGMTKVSTVLDVMTFRFDPSKLRCNKR